MLLSRLQKKIGKRKILLYLRKIISLRGFYFRQPPRALYAVKTYQKAELAFMMNMYAAM